jgi:hypothetical protein
MSVHAGVETMNKLLAAEDGEENPPWILCTSYTYQVLLPCTDFQPLLVVIGR